MEKCDGCGKEITKEMNEIAKKFEDNICYCGMESEIASLHKRVKELEEENSSLRAFAEIHGVTLKTNKVKEQ